MGAGRFRGDAGSTHFAEVISVRAAPEHQTAVRRARQSPVDTFGGAAAYGPRAENIAENFFDQRIGSQIRDASVSKNLHRPPYFL